MLQSTTSSILFATGHGNCIFFPNADGLRDPLYVRAAPAEGDQQPVMWGGRQKRSGKGESGCYARECAAEKHSFKAQPESGEDLSSPFSKALHRLQGRPLASRRSGEGAVQAPGSTVGREGIILGGWNVSVTGSLWEQYGWAALKNTVDSLIQFLYSDTDWYSYSWSSLGPERLNWWFYKIFSTPMIPWFKQGHGSTEAVDHILIN